MPITAQNQPHTLVTPPSKISVVRKVGYAFIGIMTIAMVALSIIQPLMFGAEDLPAFGSIPADGRGLPADDKRGAFLILNEPHRPQYPGDIVELLATIEAGVVDEQSGAHLLPNEIKSILIQTAAVSESSDYRVYRFGVEEDQRMKFSRDPGGKLLYIVNTNGSWKPGNYIVDIPSEGMFGGRTYYQFYVDSGLPTTPTPVSAP